MDLALILGAIGTAGTVGQCVLYVVQMRKQKADLWVRSEWGYFEEKSDSSVSAYLEVSVDNRGRRGSTIKKIVGESLSASGAVMVAEARVDSPAKLPIHIAADKSDLLKLRFDFTKDTPRFLRGKAAREWPPPLGFSLTFQFDTIVYHTYGAARLHYAAYPKDSMETQFARYLSESGVTDRER